MSRYWVDIFQATYEGYTPFPVLMSFIDIAFYEEIYNDSPDQPQISNHYITHNNSNDLN